MAAGSKPSHQTAAAPDDPRAAIGVSDETAASVRPIVATRPTLSVVSGPADTAGDSALHRIERVARAAPTLEALRIVAVNETRAAIGFRQAFVVEALDPHRVATAWRVVAASGLSHFDPDAPLTRAIGLLTKRLLERCDPFAPRVIDTSEPAPAPGGPDGTSDTSKAGDSPGTEAMSAYPFAHLMWLPMPAAPGVHGTGLLVARERAFGAGDLAAGMRLAEVIGHAARALSPRRRMGRTRRRLAITALVGLAVTAVGAIPVSLTTLAPARIVAAAPVVITAPLDGVIADAPVQPNTPVTSGQTILRFVDTRLSNEVSLARRELDVAEAKLAHARATVFGAAATQKDITVAEAEVALANAKLMAARDLLTRAEVKAPRDGLLVYAHRTDLVGRPVATGERLMEIADPTAVEVAIDLGVGDAIALETGARVRVFLDADPLTPLEATLTRMAHLATPAEDRRLVFRLSARLAPETMARIGTRGMAQLHGRTVPLAFQVLRRPVAALRQKIGL